MESSSAVIQPAVPPPTTTIRCTGGSASVRAPAAWAATVWLNRVVVSDMAGSTGWLSYRAALNGFEELMERATVSLQLDSGLPFMKGLRAMILKVALAD